MFTQQHGQLDFLTERNFTMSMKSLTLSILSVAALIITFKQTGWAAGTEVVLHKFSIPTPFSGAGFPFSGLAMDTKGNLYGTTNLGGPGTCGSGCGAVFKLTKGSNDDFTYSVIHTFAGSLTDGGNPSGAPILDSAGNVYGTAATGGEAGCGVVYKLSPNASGRYDEIVLHSFNSHPLDDDGCNPESFLVFDKAGNLYGTTNKGGGGGINGTFCLNGCGSVFKLAPNGDGTFTESVIHSFPGTPGNTDGQNPVGGLVLDNSGNLWGTTFVGGNTGPSCLAVGPPPGCGVVFELSPTMGGDWKETALFRFSNNSTGFNPSDGLVIDHAGNLYGLTENGGLGNGAVFKLTPEAAGGFKETLIHQFALCGATACPDGVHPSNGLTIDANGNLFGTVDFGGGASFDCSAGSGVALGCGVVFKFTPNANGTFTESILYRFRGSSDGGQPSDDRLVIDANGNIFGTTANGGNVPPGSFSCPGTQGCGVVFEVKP